MDAVRIQPSPERTESPEVWPLIITDLGRGKLVDPSMPGATQLLIDAGKARDLFGREKYGTPLQVNNGREPLVDALQEALDLMAYTRQHFERVNATASSVRSDRLRAWQMHLAACAVAALIATEHGRETT